MLRSAANSSVGWQRWHRITLQHYKTVLARNTNTKQFWPEPDLEMCLAKFQHKLQQNTAFHALSSIPNIFYSDVTLHEWCVQVQQCFCNCTLTVKLCTFCAFCAIFWFPAGTKCLPFLGEMKMRGVTKSCACFSFSNFNLPLVNGWHTARYSYFMWNMVVRTCPANLVHLIWPNAS